jgi:two-component system response regulator RegA
MGELGLLGIRFEATWGGTELDTLSTVVLAEELGRSTYGGFAVTAACSLAEAQQALARRQPEFAVVDLRIGSDSGLALVRQLSALTPPVRAVVLTGYGSIATAVEATKPVEVDEILAALQGERPATAAVAAPATPRSLSVRRAEWEHIQRVLANHGGNISAAARALGIHRRTLQRKLRKRPVRS